MTIERLSPGSSLQAYPPPERWDDWKEYDPRAWPRRVERRYMLVPTICFNCEAACGLLAYVDRDTMAVRKFEGNPMHPASRGRNCAKGPATINQITDPERILYPLRRKGRRGEGGWERVTWDQVLEEIGGRIRKALVEGRRNEVMYHVGRPGHERTMDRILKAWGIDGHNSHTNVCSASARLGYALWSGYDRPSPDHARARFILLLSSHLESGHYFNPHAQRIIEGKLAGAKLAVMDPRLSNTASMADYWLPTYPGSESAVLLAMANVLLEEGLADLEYVERWTNWREYMAARHPSTEPTFAHFVGALREHYREYTPELAEGESGVPRQRIVEVARLIGRARGAFASHVWRGTASGNLGGWQVARCLQLLTVLTGSVGTAGGTSPHAWNKYKPVFWEEPQGQNEWNELLFPPEWPLSHYEMTLPPAALPQGGAREARRLLHPRLQPRLDQPRRDDLDRGAEGRGEGRPARRPHPHLERDRDLRRLRPAHGPRGRAPRHPEPGDALRPLGELPPARAARGARAAGRDLPLHLRGEPGRGVGGGRVLDRAVAGGSTPTARWASVAGSSRPTVRARSSPSTSTTGGSSRTPSPVCRRRRRRRGSPPSTTCAATAPSSSSPR